MKTIRIRVSGKVQGVFFRQGTQEIASALNITGTVRNCEDDTVEIVATGSPGPLDQLVAWCWQGPPRARVIGVTTQELSLQSFSHFSIIRH